MHTNATNHIDNAWPKNKQRVLPNWCLSSQITRLHNQLKAPAWAKALFVARSGGADSLVWADSRVPGRLHVRMKNVSETAMSLVNPQPRQAVKLNFISLRPGNSWVLVGYLDEPAPEVINTPSNHDIYASTALVLGTSRGVAKARVHHALSAPYNIGRKIVIDGDFLATLEQRAMTEYLKHASPVVTHRVAMARPNGGSNLQRNVCTTPKPPAGVKPRNIHDEERANALDEAMVRYLDEDLPFPAEWATEWNELRARLNKEQQ